MWTAEIRQLLNTPSAMAARQGTLATQIVAGIAPAVAPDAVNMAPGAAGNLEAWFEKVMDRVSQRFTMWMRMWTVFFSFAIAISFCLDSAKLVPAIYKNSGLRSQLVSAAPQIADIAKQSAAPGATIQPQQLAQVYADLSATNLPKFSWGDWSQQGFPRRALGVLATALLLSLGAPFWYNTLSSLSSPRPQLAAKPSQAQTQTK
jgi:hypothetical protein